MAAQGAVKINSFTPPSGPVGTVVTISGEGFSAEPSNNLVRLSGVRAAVTAASESSLTVVVPPGAVYGPIHLTTGGLSARSSGYFNVTFPTRPLDASAFDAAQVFSTGDGPAATRLGDLDGDGRPDLVVANYYSKTISLLRNTGGGSVAGVFAAPLVLPAGQNPWFVELVDVDGDGRLDLMVVNLEGSDISIIRNVSAPGALAFAPRQDIPVAYSPHISAMEDLDDDGRPDLVVTDYFGNKVQVLKNTTSASGISFAPAVTFPTLPGPHGVGIQDLDGDGKADLVVSSHSHHLSSVAVFRNVTGPGLLDTNSFVRTAVLEADGTYVMFGDFDNDARADVAVTSFFAQNITVFQNLSAPGELARTNFGVPIRLPSAGSTKRGAVGDLDGDGQVDLAFPTEMGDSLGIRRNLGGSNQMDESWFGARTDLPSGWNGDGISIGDIDLDGLPDIVFVSFYADQVWLYRGARAAAPEISLQPLDVTVPLGGSTSLVVHATGGGLHYKWFKNDQPLPNAHGPALNISNAKSFHAGEYFVVVSNSVAAVTSTVATVTVLVERTLALSPIPDVDEGGLVTTELTLVSSGEVAGVDFVIRLNSTYLSMPEVIWDSALDGALKEYSVNTRGELRGVIAMPATAIPAGTQRLATISFRARTVQPTNVPVQLPLELLSMSDVFGDPIVGGTEVMGAGLFSIHDTGAMPGDNNANHQLDIGDATLLMRLVARLDAVRPWDIVSNDFNDNQNLDSGDVIKLLRIIAGLDAPPTSAVVASVAAPKSVGAETASLTPTQAQGNAGDLVTFQLRLDSVRTLISGASFTLNYPAAALRFMNAQGHRLATSMPSGTPAVWNLSPAQNYATQDGRLTLALSGSTAWNVSNAVLAEFTFQVQPGAAQQHRWGISIGNLEITGDGFNNRTLGPLAATFIGRPPHSAITALNVDENEVRFRFQGDSGVRYRIDYSDDLKIWIPLREVEGGDRIEVIDSSSGDSPQRFYRSVPVL